MTKRLDQHDIPRWHLRLLGSWEHQAKGGVRIGPRSDWLVLNGNLEGCNLLPQHSANRSTLQNAYWDETCGGVSLSPT